MDVMLILVLFLVLLASSKCDTLKDVPVTVTKYHSLLSPKLNPITAAETFLSSTAMSVPLVGNPVDLYNVRIQVGGQYFTTLLDSGSSNLILPGTDCFGCGSVPAAYRPSTKSKDLHIYDFVEYGLPPLLTGAYGDFYLDEIVIGGVGPVSLVVMSVTASGLQGSKSIIRAGQPMTGILGVGPENMGFLNLHGIGRLGNDSYLNALGNLDMASILALQLCTHNGFMWLGGPNYKHIETQADLEYTPTVASPHGVLLSMSPGDQVNYTISKALALVDTGTNFLLLPVLGYTEFMKVIDPQKNRFDSDGCVLERSLQPTDAEWQFPHMTISFVKNLTDMTSGKQYKVPASESYMVPSPQADGTSLWCHEIVPGGGETIILGAPMMRHFVVAFDVRKNRVGFAPQQNGTCPHDASPSLSPALPPPPPPGIPSGKVPWFGIALLSIVILVIVAAATPHLKNLYRGLNAWLYAKFLGSTEQNDLARPFM